MSTPAIARWPVEPAAPTKFVERLSDELALHVANFDQAPDDIECYFGGDVIKFHFSLSGNAEYSVAGQRTLDVGDLAAVIVLHGYGIKKTAVIDGHERTLTATISCKPSLLIDRLGISPHRLPRPIANFIEDGTSGWFTEVGRMTPSMTMAVRSLVTTSFEGLTRRAYFEARAIELICDFCQELGVSAQEPPGIGAQEMRRVERARTIIDEGYAKCLSVAAIARAVGTNESKLSLMFRQTYGMTVFEYVRCVRMNKAQGLLRATEMPVAMIAAAVGYKYQSNFAVAFRRHFGISARQARAARYV